MQLHGEPKYAKAARVAGMVLRSRKLNKVNNNHTMGAHMHMRRSV